MATERVGQAKQDPKTAQENMEGAALWCSIVHVFVACGLVLHTCTMTCTYSNKALQYPTCIPQSAFPSTPSAIGQMHLHFGHQQLACWRPASQARN